jgi:hypothetical protein
MTIQEYILEEINRRLEKKGSDVRIVAERPKPQLVADNVLQLPVKEHRE